MPLEKQHLQQSSSTRSKRYRYKYPPHTSRYPASTSTSHHNHPTHVSIHPSQAPSRLSLTTVSIPSATYARFEEFNPLHKQNHKESADPNPPRNKIWWKERKQPDWPIFRPENDSTGKRLEKRLERRWKGKGREEGEGRAYAMEIRPVSWT